MRIVAGEVFSYADYSNGHIAKKRMQQVSNSNIGKASATISRFNEIDPSLKELTLSSFEVTPNCAHIHSLKSNEHLFLENSRKNYIYVIVEGTIGCYKTLKDGRRQFVLFGQPGDILGIDQLDTFTHSAEALTPAKVKYIAVTDVNRQLQTNTEFASMLLRLTAMDLIKAREQMVSLGRQSARERFAGFIISIQNTGFVRMTGDDIITLGMKRSEIADYLGLTIETVSRLFTRLRAEKLIELLPRSRIRIKDRNSLEKIAAACM